MRWYRKLFLKTTLVAANALFFAGAIWLLAKGAQVRRDGWLDVFEDDYPWFHTVYVLFVIFLSGLVASISITGLYSVLFKRKEWVLLLYAGSTLLTFALCLFLTVEGGVSLSTASSWKSRTVADPVIEANVQSNFNSVYCLAQAAFLCTAPSTAQWLVHFGSDDMRDLFLSGAVAATVKQAMTTERSRGQQRSLLQLCEDETSVLHIPTMDRDVANLCTWCGAIDDLKSYVHLATWANSKCPPQKPSAAFCVQNVWLTYTVARGDAAASAVIENPSSRVFYQPTGDGTGQGMAMPYVQCRKTFLSYWSYLAIWFLGLSLVLLVFMGVVIRVAWVALRPKKRERDNAWQGKKPERKPLVQLATTSTTINNTTRPTAATGTSTSGFFKASTPKAAAKDKSKTKNKRST